MSNYQSFSLWLLHVFVVSGLLVFFLWLSLLPSSPNYNIVDFNVNDTVSFGLEASNDNRDENVYYNDINVTICFGNDDIGSTMLPSFSQGHEKIVTVGENVMKKVVRAAGNRKADLKMGLVTTVRYRIWKWRSKAHRMMMEARVEVGRDGKTRKKIKMRRKKRVRKLLSK